MIKLRLQRKGRKKRPFYHIVVADSRSPRDGRIIERLGRFDNVSEDKQLTYDEERVIHWLKIGAQPSDTVRSILKKEGILYKMHLMRWGKSDEEIEAALEEWRTAKENKDSDSEVSRKAKQKAQLKAEENEYKKQLEEKAAAAAKELEKKKEAEAKAKAEEEAKEKAAAESEKAEEAKTAEKEPTKAAEADKEAEAETAKEEVKTDEAEEVETEEKEQTETEETTSEDDNQKEVKEEETQTAETSTKEEETKGESPAVSTEMNANEAIDHIKNTDIKDLEGFVTDDEDRVTVQRAWESKQAETE